MLNKPLLKTLGYIPNRPNGIGGMGENLTIVMLSLERSHLTIRLLDSFCKHMPLFKGKFLIIDNGSNKETLHNLHTYIQNSQLNIALIEAKTNLGVAGGRNYSTQFISTDWLMFLDNDIYIDGNFLPLLNEEILLLGAHFVSLPLKNPDGTFFAKGGELTLMNFKNKSLYIDCGSANSNLEYPEFSSFLFGGAAVLKASTFHQNGMFNQKLFVGLEDIEFSIRLWKRGFKVGHSTAKYFIHDHQAPIKSDDIEYEKKRSSSVHIINSAKYAELEHYYKFLSPDGIAWHESRLPQQLKRDNNQSNSCNSKIGIAIIINAIDEEVANVAFNLLNLNQNIFNFIVLPTYDKQSFGGNSLRIILAAADCQILHFMWRESLFDLSKNIKDCCHILFDNKKITSNYIDNKIVSTCVYDHRMIPNEDKTVFTAFAQLVKKNYYVSSRKLFDIYSNIEGLEPPRSICDIGVDLKLFTPNNQFKFNLDQLSSRKIIIGCVGNSLWTHDDYNSLYTIIKPTIEQLIREGYPIQLEIVDRSIVWHEMPDFYNSIDIYICASLHEKIPNTILEAMACGLLVVTTDAGVVREALGPLQQDYIVHRTLDDVYAKLKLLLDNIPLWQTLSLENLEYIQYWDWSLKTSKILDYFVTLAKENGLSLLEC